MEDIRKYPAQYDSCLLFVGDVCVSVGGICIYISFGKFSHCKIVYE